MNIEQLNRLSGFIEENLRSSQSAGLKFIDSGNLKSRLTNKQNHVIFGRRGAGKSTFVSSLKEESQNFISVYVDLDVYKDISFPNILIKVLIVILDELEKFADSKIRFYEHPILWFRKNTFIRNLEEVKQQLEEILESADTEQKQVKTKTSSSVEIGTSAQLGNEKANIKGSDNTKYGSEEEIQKTVAFDKLDYLKKNISKFQKIFSEASKLCNDSPIFLTLDDFYFIPKATQPEFIDFFHRLTKGTPLFLKVATIKHRSNLYLSGESYIGVEINHDIYPIDLDYTLDRLSDLEDFMKRLLQRAVDDSKAEINIDELFTPNGFRQLCIASGGVPRDFLSLFVNLLEKLGRKVAQGNVDRIDMVDVRESAISAIQSKRNSLNIDSADDKHILEEYLNHIKDLIYQDKRTNIFLASKDDLEQNKQARQAIRELVDLRFLHLVESNTSSAPSDGKVYEAYMIDVGLYDNSRPRNFKQIEPGVTDENFRKDNIRSCPKLNLKNLESEVGKVFSQQQLLLTE